MYFVKARSFLKALFPKDLVWKRNTASTVYLTFDDGPHPEATPFVLNELKKYGAKATFFCIGKNITEHSDLFLQTKEAGHKIGNHTYNHLNGWQVSTEEYLDNIKVASQVIDSKLFRPPYGRIKRTQAQAIKSIGYTIVMWDVLSGDFDTTISPEKCWKNIESNIEPGSIIVFHDSSKALERLKYALPKTLEFCRNKGWKMETL